jgi:uncharacterized BrkB/YihY/UPF0761 family membrane protein
MQRLDKLTNFHGHIVSITVAFLLGLIFWLLYRWVPDILPFVIAWTIVRPLFKIHQFIDREMNL